MKNLFLDIGAMVVFILVARILEYFFGNWDSHLLLAMSFYILYKKEDR